MKQDVLRVKVKKMSFVREISSLGDILLPVLVEHPFQLPKKGNGDIPDFMLDLHALGNAFGRCLSPLVVQINVASEIHFATPFVMPSGECKSAESQTQPPISRQSAEKPRRGRSASR